MYNRRILPFYMTYPLPIGYQEENTAIRDFEYLQELYPQEARKCQKTVAEVMDQFDFEGSIIYDEYPDRCQLHQLAADIMERMKNDNHHEEDEKRQHLPDLIQMTVCNEVYRRRHCQRKGILNF